MIGLRVMPTSSTTDRVFILGAGASLFAGFPLGRDLLPFLIDHASCDGGGGSFEWLITYVLSLPQSQRAAQNLELLLTRLELGGLGNERDLQVYEINEARESLIGMMRHLLANQGYLDWDASAFYRRKLNIGMRRAELSQSTNAKVVVIGSGKDGLPIILGNVDTPAPPAGSTPANGPDTTNKESTTAAGPAVPLEKTPAAALATPPEKIPPASSSTPSGTNPETRWLWPISLSDIETYLTQMLLPTERKTEPRSRQPAQ
jgi:hypothetical protein